MNKRSVEGMNRMSVSEQLTYFFEGIEMVIGKKEKKALQARNFSAHGSFAVDNIDYEEQLYLFRTPLVENDIRISV